MPVQVLNRLDYHKSGIFQGDFNFTIKELKTVNSLLLILIYSISHQNSKIKN